MFLHELSRSISQNWPMRVDGEEYESLVRECFQNLCPYCSRELSPAISVIEHLDGMNRYRAGLHVPGNVLVACKKCNSEKRRDDSKLILSLASTSWESFLSHNGKRCTSPCQTCQYWTTVWQDPLDMDRKLEVNLQRIRSFRGQFIDFQTKIPILQQELSSFLIKLYSDCQNFAEMEIKELLVRFK